MASWATKKSGFGFAANYGDQKDSDSDGDSNSSLSDVENYAHRMMKVKSGGQVKSKVFVNKSNMSNSSSASAQGQSKKKQKGNNNSASSALAKSKELSGSLMGLDDFKVSGSSKSKPEQNLTNTVILQWPLSDKYDFQLACQLCFRKEGEGVLGYKYVPDHPHKCPYNILIIRSKHKTGSNWMKVRPRPNTETFFVAYKRCLQFDQAERCRCRNGETDCTFAHNDAEIELWNKERDQVFSIPTFLKTAQREGMVSSQILENRQKKQEASQKQNVTKENETTSKTTEPVITASMQFQPKIKQFKIPSANPAPTTPRAPVTNVVQPSMTINYASTKPPPIRMLPPSLSGATFGPPPFLSMRPPPINSQQTGATHPQQPPPPLPRTSGPSISTPILTSPPPPLSSSSSSSTFNKSPPVPGSHKSGSSPHRRHDMPVVMIDNPLPGYHFELCCKQCLTLRPVGWIYDYNSTFIHSCSQNILAYCIKDAYSRDSWVMVRERTSHRDFKGSYALCHSVVTSNRESCRHHDNCSFAHNPIEKNLWMLEKSGHFNITEFIVQHQGKLSKKGNMSPDSVKELIDMYGGYFRFICRKCFFQSQIVSEGDGGMCGGRTKHEWLSNCILAHVNGSAYTVIDNRKFVHPGAYYKLCKFLNSCYAWSTDSCIFAHSKVEMSVWRLERGSSITRDEIVKMSSKIYINLHYKDQSSKPGQAEPAVKIEEVQGAIGADARPGLTPIPRGFEEPPVRIGEFCRTCWGHGQKYQQDGDKDRCLRGHSNYKVNKVYVAMTTSKEVRSRPRGMTHGMKFMLCNSRSKCQKKICTFPHSQEEMDVWTYMTKYNMTDLSEVVLKWKEFEKVRTPKPTAPATERDKTINIGAPSHHAPAWSSHSKPANQIIAPGDLDINEFYCQYCSISCDSQARWDDHCAGTKHRDNVNWDRDHTWHFRQPPWGQTDSLMACASHMYNRSCRYSNVDDRYNLCKYAHSQDELDEWKERHEFRKMKRTMALQRHMFSYTESLMDEYNKSDQNTTVLNDALSGVMMKSDHLSSIFKKEKNATHTWTFEVQSKKPLEKVALLLNQDRLHFHLLTPDGSRHQVSTGYEFLNVDEATGKHVYKLQVTFSGGLFGSFRQWLSLDFGSRPVLIRKLMVDVGHQSRQAKVQDLQKNLDFSRWTRQNKEIVHSSDYESDVFEEQLLTKYKVPVSVEDIFTSDSLKELNRHNYIHKMHKLIELEEMTRQRILASYNVHTKVTPSNRIEEFGIFIQSGQGEMFLKVQLSEALTVDTQAGKLLLTSVNTALIALTGSKAETVYEAHIVKENNYGYNGVGQGHIYLVVCRTSVSALRLEAGKDVEVEIQFQMDRLFFCRMHYALDNLENTDLVFPDVLKFKPLLGRDVKVSSKFLNEDQMKAVRHIVIDRDTYSPPFIMYGPFGTGKTETLALATLSLLRDKRSCRVLICTQSNSAADLYINNHFDKFMTETHGKYKLLRVVNRKRRMQTINETVLKYCVMDENNQFRIPSKEEILKYQVILVTVESSIIFSTMALHGCFTHIFVDEAGQTLETEILMPLCLASNKTCIVLTGDHLQISPPVYSLVAQQQNFHVSILVRLFNYYDALARGPVVDNVPDNVQKSPLKIQLSINYRTRREILRFIATVFYGGPENLIACDEHIPRVLSRPSLAFYSVQGKESLSTRCMSYMNPTEAVEVVSQVKQLLDEWPPEWGPRRPQSIAVISNYLDQVKCIRETLKKDLRNVFVDTIQSVQGKEFRAVFVSTVRTTNLLREPHILEALNRGEDIGDLGFLSNRKLINTALTRAQSFVGVVGDPVALCLVGECTQEWRVYIRHCDELKSIYPPMHDYEFVRHQVVHLQRGPEGEIVDKLCRQKSEQNEQYFPPLPEPPAVDKESEKEMPIEINGVKDRTDNLAGAATQFFPSVNDVNVNEDSENRNHLMDSLEMFFQQPLPNIRPTSALSSNQTPVRKRQPVSTAHLTLNGEVSIEDIIFQLSKENISGFGQSSDHIGIKSEYIYVTEKNGFASLTYGPEKKPGAEPFKITSYNEDFVAFSVYNRDNAVTVEFENWSLERLKSHVGKLGFFRCRMSVAGDKRVAVVLPPNTDEMRQGMDWTGKEVDFVHQFDCGHAMVGDEVLVKLSDKSINGRLIGQVKGVLRSAHDKTNRLLVCQACPDDPGILRPLDKNLPHLYSLTNSTRLGIAEKGHVPVYNFAHREGIEFSRYEKIKTETSERCLFIVRYLTWPEKISLPVGLVVGSLEPGTSLEGGMKILSVEHGLGRNLPSTADGTENPILTNDFALSEELVKGRMNLTGLYSFTMVEEGGQEVEMAVHMEESGENYRIGIHITDVVAFINKDSVLDRDCESRSPSLHMPTGEPRYMLPVQACTDLCSLKLGCDRLAITLVMTVDSSGNQVKDLEVVRSVINVKHQFSLAEVQSILLDSDIEEASDFYQSCIVTLYMLTTFWRTQRLGNSSFSSQLPPGQQDKQHTHLMLDELRHQVNSGVASLLEKSLPQCTPLLVQLAPNQDKMDKWRRESARHAFSCIPASRAFLHKQVCRCMEMCKCVFAYMRAHQLQHTQKVLIIKDAWRALCHASRPDDFDAEKARDLISDVKNLPEMTSCSIKLAAIEPAEYYVCSGLVSQLEKEHYTMNLACYTPLTSPMQEYLSIVVQRLLVAHMEGSGSPYITQEVAELCAGANADRRRKSSLEHESFRLHLSTGLQSHPLSVVGVVEKVDSQKMVLSLAGIEQILEEERTVTLTDLTPANVKVVDQQNDEIVKIAWDESIFRYSGSATSTGLNQSDILELDSNRLVYAIPSHRWQQLLIATRKMVSLDAGEEEFSMFSEHLKNMTKDLEEQEVSANILHPEPVCESNKDGVSRRQASFFMTVHPSQCVRVQMGSCLNDSLPGLSIKLLELTDQLDICVEHRSSPESCFCLPQTPTPNNSFSTITAYKNHWASSLVSGAAREAVREGERMTIHGVGIAWSRPQDNGSGRLSVRGELMLSKSFCTRSLIRLPAETNQEESKDVESCLAFMCVRYKGINLDSFHSSDPDVTTLINASNKVTWVGHCTVTNVIHGSNGVTIKLRLVQSGFPIPDKLLQKEGHKVTCTVEWIGKGRHFSVLDETVRQLNQSSQFVQDVILGKKPTNTIEPIEMPKGMYLEHLSKHQQMALGDSYSNPFSLILGGPGTGKSILASCLAALLVFRNAKVDRLLQHAASSPPGVVPNAQLMVCAPTEHALDVLTGYIKTLNQNMNLVRVYEEEVEESDFPTAFKSTSTKYKPSDQKCTVMKDLALHHLIRVHRKSIENDNLLQQEMLLSMYGDNSSQWSAVQTATELAQRYHLSKAHIILCTCLTSARKIVRDFTNIKQVIVDDASHCTELESLLPVVWHPRVHQMILMGDRQMPRPSNLKLCPSVNPHTSSLGQSLIHRLGDLAKTEFTQQFRCNNNLYEFPSNYFYSGLLTSNDTTPIPPSPIPTFPWPTQDGFHSFLYHMEGGQECMGTNQGDLYGDRQPGYINKEEAAMIRNLVWAMVVKHQVSPASILILTFSQPQRDLIQNAVMQVGLNNITVCPVRESLGRENQFVLVSTVRSVPTSGVPHPPLTSWIRRHLGSVADPYYVNIAITRAQKALFIFGNKELLSVCEPWRSLLEFYNSRRAVVMRLNL